MSSIKDRHLKVIAAMMAEGATASAIARKIGVTRNAVLGYIYRNRKSLPTWGTGPVGDRKSRSERPTASVKAAKASAEKAARAAKKLTEALDKLGKTSKSLPPQPLPEFIPAIDNPGIPFIDRESGQCARIISKDGDPLMVCGLPVINRYARVATDRSLCPACAKRAYQGATDETIARKIAKRPLSLTYKGEGNG